MNVLTADEEKVEALALQVNGLERRLNRLESKLFGTIEVAEPVARPLPVAPPPARPAPAPAVVGVPELRPASDWTLPRVEDLLGRRVLALVGGVAFLLGIAFFVALAVERGWIGETTRVVLALLASGAVLGAGFWLYERHGRLQAALAMVGAGIAGLYLTLA